MNFNLGRCNDSGGLVDNGSEMNGRRNWGGRVDRRNQEVSRRDYNLIQEVREFKQRSLLNSSNTKLLEGTSSNGVRVGINQVGDGSSKLAGGGGVISDSDLILNLNSNLSRESRPTDKRKNVMIGMDVDFVFSSEKERSPVKEGKDLIGNINQGLEKVVDLVGDVGALKVQGGPVILETVVGPPLVQPVKGVVVDLIRDGEASTR
ncbi:hypothetical protein LWI29_024284 [Acer saccharum]|uniref:Uncharacterized protein n=1 Tax=Acer saccharum TaxID=4024 RepID=A0AA39VN48_ACESA|nr:hypothetical protein LWI29_024284 [Acer saccharum]